MTRRGRLPVNEDLSKSNPLPDDQAFLRAILAVDDSRVYPLGATAAEVAAGLGIIGMRRLGNGAVKGSWSGGMSPALRVAPRLLSLKKRGLVYRHSNRGENGYLRVFYALTLAGRAEIEAARDA
jgi:hypothetical protein